MKILFVSYHYWPHHFGGELLISIERFEALVKRGHKVTVLTSGVPTFSKKEEKNGLIILRSPAIHDSRFGRGLRRLVFPFWAVLKMSKLDFNIMHLSGAGGIDEITHNINNWMIGRYAKFKKAKTVWVHSLADTETEMFTEKQLKYKMRKLFLTQIDLIIAVGPALFLDVKQYYPKKAILIKNKVRDDIFSPLPDIERRKFRTENGVKDNNIVWLFLGSVTKRKGFDILARAFLKMSSQNQNLKLWIIGPKSSNENQNLQKNDDIIQLTNELDCLKVNVKFWGRIDDRNQVAKILSSSDIFVFPTRKEGLPLSPLEAMATKLPVIISKLPGVTDVAIEDKVSGLFFKPGDEVSFLCAIEELVNDPCMRKKIGNLGYSKIKKEFNWNKFIDEWEKAYLNLVNQ